MKSKPKPQKRCPHCAERGVVKWKVLAGKLTKTCRYCGGILP